MEIEEICNRPMHLSLAYEVRGWTPLKIVTTFVRDSTLVLKARRMPIRRTCSTAYNLFKWKLPVGRNADGTKILYCNSLVCIRVVLFLKGTFHVLCFSHPPTRHLVVAYMYMYIETLQPKYFED